MAGYKPLLENDIVLVAISLSSLCSVYSSILT